MWFIIHFNVSNAHYLGGGNIPYKLINNILWGFFHYYNSRLILERFPQGVFGVSYHALMVINVLAVCTTLITNAFFERAWRKFVVLIFEGNFDRAMVQPQSILMGIFAYNIRLQPFTRLFVILPALYYHLHTITVPYTPWYMYIFACFLYMWGIVGIFALQTILHSIVFWLPSATNINEFANYIVSTSRTPSVIFQKVVNEIYLAFLPGIFGASLPVLTIFYGPRWQLIGIHMGVVSFLIFCAYIVYHRGLHDYTSAGG